MDDTSVPQEKPAWRVQKEIKEKMLALILAAFGLIAALAWNEAIKSLIDTLFPLERNTLLVKFGYALLSTVIIVLVSMYLNRVLKQQTPEG